MSSSDVLPRQLPFLVVAAMSGILLLSFFTVRRLVIDVSHEDRGTHANSGMQRALGKLDRSSRPVFLDATILALIAFPANALVSAAASFYVTRELGEPSRAIIALPIAAGFIATALGQVLVRRVSIRSSRLIGHAVLFAGAAALFVAMLTPSWMVLVAGSVLIGLGTGLASGSGLASITGLPDRRQTAGLMNRYFVILYLGLFIPITALGVLEQSIGVIQGTEVACVICVGALVVSFGARAILRRRRFSASVS